MSKYQVAPIQVQPAEQSQNVDDISPKSSPVGSPEAFRQQNPNQFVSPGMGIAQSPDFPMCMTNDSAVPPKGIKGLTPDGDKLGSPKNEAKGTLSPKLGAQPKAHLFSRESFRHQALSDGGDTVVTKIFAGEKKIRLSTFEDDDREALAPLDLGGDGSIDISDLKAAAKMYSAAQAQKAIPFDAFPSAVQDTLKIFDQDGDCTIDPKELASAGQLYHEAKNAQKRLLTTTIVMGVVSILVLASMLGVTMLAVDVMKETNTGSNGIMTVAGTSTPVQVQENKVNVPLGAIPLLAPDNPVQFLDQMKTVTLKVPEGGYQRSTVTDARLQYNYANQTVGVIIYTSHGHSLQVFPDPQNITTEAHVKLQGGRSFDVCAPCGDCGAISILLSDAQKETLNNYLAQATQKVNNGESRACRLSPGRIAQVSSRGFQGLGDDADGLCGAVATDGVSDTYFGDGQFTDEDGDLISVKFAVHGTHNAMKMSYTDPDTAPDQPPTRMVVYDGTHAFVYRGGRLVKCAEDVPFNAGTNLRTGLVGDDADCNCDFTVTNVNDGAYDLQLPPTPTDEQCAAVNTVNERHAEANGDRVSSTPGSSERRAQMLGGKLDGKTGINELGMLGYLKAIEEMDSQGRRPKGLETTEARMAADAYTHATYTQDNAAVYVEGCSFAFRGSNAPTTWDGLNDWWSNIVGAFMSSVAVGGASSARVHSGFRTEFYKLQPHINADVGNCGSPKWIGHSLGGAMAVIAREYYGKGNVYTYGQPGVFDGNYGCRLSGARLFHDEDPVASDFLGFMSGFKPAQSATKIRWRCTKRHWWGGCKRSTWETTGASCTENSGWIEYNVGAHALGTQPNENTYREWSDGSGSRRANAV